MALHGRNFGFCERRTQALRASRRLWHSMDASYLLSYHHLRWPYSDMGLRDLLPVPRMDRRTRSKDSSKADSTEGARVANLAVLPHSEPDLRIGSSILPESGSSTSHSKESDSTWAALFPVAHLTIFSPNSGDRTISERFRSVFSKKESKRPHISNNPSDPGAAGDSGSGWKSTAYSTTKLAINMVKESSDVFPPLKSVAAGLSAILDHCDVQFISLIPLHALYSRLS